ncbi:MAG: hypothetical protein FJX68_02425 [Alphaproteobacteria bacterium]|nr:hypothetical protein [Alphaproteobacteria bacterium]
MLGLLLAAGIWLSLARAQAGAAEQAATAALAGQANAAVMLRAYLAGGQPNPTQVAERAGALMRALQQQAGGDLLALQQALVAVEHQAALALRAAAVLRVGMLDGFIVPPEVLAFDFGPVAQPAAPGFERIGPADPRLLGGAVQAIGGPPGDFLADGVVGLTGLTIPVPPGDWRVILLVGDTVRGDSAILFGQQLSFNGQPVPIAASGPAQWLNAGYLTGPGGLAVSGVSEQAGQLVVSLQGAALNGAAVVQTISLSGAALSLQFLPAPGQQTALSALLLEPATSQSALLPSPAAAQALATDEVAILAAEAQIQAQLAGILTEVATAAGASPGELAILFPPGGPPLAEPNVAASAN